jgi:hypothetical protein
MAPLAQTVNKLADQPRFETALVGLFALSFVVRRNWYFCGARFHSKYQSRLTTKFGFTWRAAYARRDEEVSQLVPDGP